VKRRDLPDRRLVQLTCAALGAIVLWFVVRPALPEAWHTPGSAQLYFTGVAGAALLLVPVAFALAKRGGANRNPVNWFNAHVGCSLAGAVLIAIHSGGFLRRPPALMLLAIVALAILGIWARLRGSRRMAASFGAKAPGFAPPGAAIRGRLATLIQEKRDLLARLDPRALESTFSVTLRHCLRAPRLALDYHRLAREEAGLLGTRNAAGFAQRAWRPIHLLLAWTFVAGVVIHVITVTFFAGWVADGEPVGWWHVAAW
jgi:hypothetical protein